MRFQSVIWSLTGPVRLHHNGLPWPCGGGGEGALEGFIGSPVGGSYTFLNGTVEDIRIYANEMIHVNNVIGCTCLLPFMIGR